MRTTRSHPRIRDTGDLHATLRLIGRSPQDGEVLNLSEGGMLVACAGLRLGERAGFDLEGPGFQYTGVVEVAHFTARTTGLRFLSWHGQAQRPVRSLIDRRAARADPKHVTRRDRPTVRREAAFLGPQRPTRQDVEPLVRLRDHYSGLLLAASPQQAAAGQPLEPRGLWRFLGGYPV
jgi:hypothetical protein